MRLLRLGFITDIHSGNDTSNKRGSKALGLTQNFVLTANQMNVDASIFAGDVVIYTDRKPLARQHLIRITECFNGLRSPIYKNRGNHEDFLWPSPDEQKKLGIPAESYSVEKNGFIIVMWNPSVVMAPQNGLSMHPSDLEWLQKTLDDATLPCIVSTHVPLDNDAYDDKHVQKHDGHRPFFSFYPQGSEARRIMNESGKVIACLAGHRHRNRHRQFEGEDIHFITRGSLVNAHNPADPPDGEFSIIDIAENTIGVSGFGRNQTSLMLPYVTPRAFKPVIKRSGALLEMA